MKKMRFWKGVMFSLLLVFLAGCAAQAAGNAKDLKTTPAIAKEQPKAAMASATPAPKDEKKHTKIGKYVTASEAYEMWKANPDKVNIIDCRIPEEYAFVGHGTMAHNIPSKLWTGAWNPEKKDFDLKDNPDFESFAKKKFGLSDTLMVMCRSGHRSAASVNRLFAAGFTNVYNIVDGFEGDKIKDDESYYNGKRMKNGWKNSGAPWTYDLDPKLLYLPEAK